MSHTHTMDIMDINAAIIKAGDNLLNAINKLAEECRQDYIRAMERSVMKSKLTQSVLTSEESTISMGKQEDAILLTHQTIPEADHGQRRLALQYPDGAAALKLQEGREDEDQDHQSMIDNGLPQTAAISQGAVKLKYAEVSTPITSSFPQKSDTMSADLRKYASPQHKPGSISANEMSGEHRTRYCKPARRHDCWNCGRGGHYARNCFRQGYYNWQRRLPLPHSHTRGRSDRNGNWRTSNGKGGEIQRDPNQTGNFHEWQLSLPRTGFPSNWSSDSPKNIQVDGKDRRQQYQPTNYLSSSSSSSCDVRMNEQHYSECTNLRWRASVQYQPSRLVRNPGRADRDMNWRASSNSYRPVECREGVERQRYGRPPSNFNNRQH